MLKKLYEGKGMITSSALFLKACIQINSMQQDWFHNLNMQNHPLPSGCSLNEGDRLAHLFNIIEDTGIYDPLEN